MSNLAVVYLHLDFDLSSNDLEATREYLRNVATRYAAIIYRQELNVQIELRDGSIKAWILIAGSLYLGIGQYGSFRSGVDQLIRDSKTIQQYVSDTLVKDGVSKSRILEVKRNRCLPDRIRQLFLRIDRFEKKISDMSHDEIIRESELIAKSATKISDEFEHEKDREEFISCLEGTFDSLPQWLEPDFRPAIRREEDYTDQLMAPDVNKELSIAPFRGLESMDVDKEFLFMPAPLVLRSRDRK